MVSAALSTNDDGLTDSAFTISSAIGATTDVNTAAAAAFFTAGAAMSAISSRLWEDAGIDDGRFPTVSLVESFLSLAVSSCASADAPACSTEY